MMQRYGQINCVGSKLRRKYAKKAQPEGAINLSDNYAVLTLHR